MARFDPSVDIELAEADGSSPLPDDRGSHGLQKLRKLLTRSNTHDDNSMTQVQNPRPGYPRFAALLAAYPSFNNYRRFSAIRARLLLAKQDRLASLEAELQETDGNEENALFLGNMRRDSNSARKRILAAVDLALADYDNLIQRSSRILQLRAASSRDILSLQNWVNGTASLARDETDYLSRASDLFSVDTGSDDACAHLERMLEAFAERLYQRFSKDPGLPRSSDPEVFVVASPFIRPIARFLLALVLVILLMVPVAVVNAVKSMRMRMLVISLATLTVVFGICGLTTVKMTKVFLCGATYTTIMVMFVSGTSPSI